jgi:hypothetical protein
MISNSNFYFTMSFRTGRKPGEEPYDPKSLNNSEPELSSRYAGKKAPGSLKCVGCPFGHW